MSVLAYVGLGSNLGPREHHIESALVELDRGQGIHLLRKSPLYETAPVGGPPQGKYLNGVAEIEAEIPAADLLSCLLAIEERLGRVRRERWGPRVIDLDLLLYGSEEFEEPQLILPHPRLREREFVLRPLADLDRDLPIPPDGEKVGDLLDAIQEVTR
ncbi:MAG: 2-amino-4-hydroxy-6-hydroxymethyldihydropteridine diphosphokinase [Planctomycetota bacterium]|nr:2-amino-4-hydroxy-6-hydroxymethyldihydropteridine diphosphokinase [Planctomycetota bacterium]